MSRAFLVKSPLQMVTAVAIIFMLLDVFLPLNLPTKMEAPNGPFKLTMMVEKTNFQTGEPVNITFTLENIGNETITLYTNSDIYSLVVYNENNIKAYEPDLVYGMIAFPYRIQPSEVKGGNYTWRQYYYESEIAPNRQQVRPGRYRISGMFVSSTFGLIVETSSIIITIG